LAKEVPKAYLGGAFTGPFTMEISQVKEAAPGEKPVKSFVLDLVPSIKKFQ
jgi:hypothetical protein